MLSFQAVAGLEEGFSGYGGGEELMMGSEVSRI
jgi:hypothetical protein